MTQLLLSRPSRRGRGRARALGSPFGPRALRPLLGRLLEPMAALGVAGALLAPTAGAAQTSQTTTGGRISVGITTVGGVSQDTVGTIWLNLVHCQENAPVVFDIDGVPNAQTLSIYVGSQCNTAESRDGQGTDCVQLGTEEIGGRTQDIRVTLGVGDIVRAALDTTDCGSVSSKPEIWFLAVDNANTTEAVPDTNYGMRALNVDTAPPRPPTSIRGGRGEAQIPVSWSVGSERVNGFEIYVDSGSGPAPGSDAAVAVPSDDMGDGGVSPTAGATNPDCGTGALTEGAAADSVLSYRAKEVRSPTATSTNLARSDIQGERAAVAVAAVDEAGNKSTLSKVECVEIVPTTGLKDLYEQNHGPIPQGCPCAAAGPAQLEGALPIALALTALAYRRRRRT